MSTNMQIIICLHNKKINDIIHYKGGDIVMNKKSNKQLNTRLKELREGKNLTVKQLSDELSVNPSTLSQYENDKRVPNLDVIKRASIYFEVPADYILKFDTDPEYSRIASKFNRNSSDVIGILTFLATKKEIEVADDYIKLIKEDDSLKNRIKHNGRDVFKSAKTELLMASMSEMYHKMDKFLNYDDFI